VSEAPQPDRHHWLQRLLEMVPGLISWAIILGPIWLSFSYPWLVAYFVLSFDFYMLCRALWFGVTVVIGYGRVRRVLATEWMPRVMGLANPVARRRELKAQLDALRAGSSLQSLGFAALPAERASRALRQRAIQDELADLDRLGRTGADAPDWSAYTQLALIPTYTEPRKILRQTVRALAEAEWPRERKICAIITRESDEQGIANVASLRDEFGDHFVQFIHILDPLEPGIVVGKSSAMAWGGRYLYRLLVREQGMDPSRILITDLDADFRVHPQYFAYLAHTHLSDANRETQLYQPIPYFHNNIWQAPILLRLFAAVLTQLQLWRSVLPEKLISFSSYSTTLNMVHEVGYWATDAIPEDSRFFWKSYFRYGDRFRAVPLFIPIYGDAVRARTYWRSMIVQYTQARRWAWGVTDIPYVVRNAIRHTEIPLLSRSWRVANLFWEHISWAIGPFVVTFGALIPLVLNPAFGQTILGQNLPLYASTMLTLAFVSLFVMIYVENAIVPPRPAHWGRVPRLISYLQWIGLPIIGILFSNLPALDAQTRLLTGRYLEYRVTEKA
jgi:Glycosyl transferase family group 2